MIEYQKIYVPFTRAVDGPNRNKLIMDDWLLPEFAYLHGTPWEFTEKIDGTNIRVGWDGHTVEFGGRTDNAQISAKLVAYLRETFTEELFEQCFQDTPTVLFGEGFGAGIQKGHVYLPHQSFILFDVKVGDWWLLPDAVDDVAIKLGIAMVPTLLTGTLYDGITAVREGTLRSHFGDFQPEGVVGRPTTQLFNRKGERIMVKIKKNDFAVRGT